MSSSIMAEARFLRSFSETVSLIAPGGAHDLSDAESTEVSFTHSI
jgi:hypothetical protein